MAAAPAAEAAAAPAAPAAGIPAPLAGLSLDTDQFVDVLRGVIGEAKYVQNNPRQGLVPDESKVSAHLLPLLEPHTEANGGPLRVEVLEFVPGRHNIKITYPGTSEKTVGLMGSHMDVVPANPETWDWDPFSLTVEGDRLYGRGTTDCLGHCVLVTLFFVELAKRRPALKNTVVGLLIAGEEGGETGVGVDCCVESGAIEELKRGPVYWIDSADSQPCIATAGVLQWHIKAIGRLFHSGLPHRGINSLELCSEAVAEVQRRFYADYPPHPEETRYNFTTPSTMKPTQVECAQGALNQLPPWTTISGDVRLTPFYDILEVRQRIESYVADINANVGDLPTRGPCSKYEIEGEGEGGMQRGRLELTWGGTLEEVRHMEGIACKLDSPGLAAIVDAIRSVRGSATPYSITGSLPLVREMQAAGFDLQITGFGLSSTYHAVNEYALLTDMCDAFKVLAHVVASLEGSMHE